METRYMLRDSGSGVWAGLPRHLTANCGCRNGQALSRRLDGRGLGQMRARPGAIRTGAKAQGLRGGRSGSSLAAWG